MNAEFFEALALLEKEKGISVEYLCEKIENAIAIAIRRDYIGTEDVKVVIDPETRTFDVAIRKLVVEEVEDPANQILLEKAVKYNNVWYYTVSRSEAEALVNGYFPDSHKAFDPGNYFININ